MPPDALWVGSASAVSEYWVLLGPVDLPRNLAALLAHVHFLFLARKGPGAPFFLTLSVNMWVVLTPA